MLHDKSLSDCLQGTLAFCIGVTGLPVEKSSGQKTLSETRK